MLRWKTRVNGSESAVSSRGLTDRTAGSGKIVGQWPINGECLLSPPLSSFKSPVHCLSSPSASLLHYPLTPPPPVCLWWTLRNITKEKRHTPVCSIGEGWELGGWAGGWGGEGVEQRALTQYLMKEQREMKGKGGGGWGGGQRRSRLERWKE